MGKRILRELIRSKKRKIKRIDRTVTAESKVMSMKLLIDTSGKRVLFAEAGKDCVDFLFFILTLPLSTLIRLLGKRQMLGSLPNLYESIETLNECYIQPNISKDTLLKPLSPLPAYPVPLLALEEAPIDKNFYTCGRCSAFKGKANRNVTDDTRATCPNCHERMDSHVTYVAPPGDVRQEDSGGFVKEVVTYMVMDDLTVRPMSAISSITLLAKFNIKNVGALEEKVVNLGMNEAVKLLKASLVSNNVLTDVFLHGEKRLRST